MAGRIGRIFTVIGLLLLTTAWLWWLYLYRSVDAITCIYLPHGACPPPASGGLPLAVPPYEPMALWIGGAAVLIGFVLRLLSR
jgi:hypothetical protein